MGTITESNNDENTKAKNKNEEDSVITLEEGDGNYTNSNSNGNSNDESTFASTIEDSNTVTLDDLHSIDTDNTVLVADASILPESSLAAFTTSMILMPTVFVATAIATL